jgi:signal transduction histidine kinase
MFVIAHNKIFYRRCALFLPSFPVHTIKFILSVSLLRDTMDPRIKIVVHTDKNPCIVMANPGQISNILINLLTNARDAINVLKDFSSLNAKKKSHLLLI